MIFRSWTSGRIGEWSLGKGKWRCVLWLPNFTAWTEYLGGPAGSRSSRSEMSSPSEFMRKTWESQVANVVTLAGQNARENPISFYYREIGLQVSAKTSPLRLHWILLSMHMKKLPKVRKWQPEWRKQSQEIRQVWK